MRNCKPSKKVIFVWCLYDWAIAAFPVIVITFIFSAYFTSKVAENSIIGTEQWGNAMAIAAVFVAVLSPILGAIADHTGKRKYWLGLFTGLLILSSALLWFAYARVTASHFTLGVVILGTIGINISNVFYNAMLPHITSSNTIGRVSGWGWGCGYLGGLSLLLIAYYGFVNHAPHWLNQSTYEQIRICGPLVAVWILIFSWPLFVWLPEYSSSKLNVKQALLQSRQDLRHSLHILWHDKNLLIFFSAQMIYLDGLNTLFAFAGIYAAGTFKMSMSQVLLFGIAMNASAGIGSILLAFITDWFGSKRTILLSLFALILFGLGIVLTHNQSTFLKVGCCLSFFVGTLQSSSRSLLASIVPKQHETMMFGFSALSGKVSAFLGPLILGFVTAEFNSQRIGMSTVLIFFVIGGLLLGFCKEKQTT